MSKLIDADALWMDIIHSMDYCDDILEIIERQPTIKERKTGRWIDKKCSRCGCGSMLGLCIENFCPNCGADMRGEQDDESKSKSNAQTDTRARGMGTTDKSSGI